MDSVPREERLVFIVVNVVNVAQTTGFLTRPIDPEINHWLGYLMLAMVVPAAMAVAGYVRRGDRGRATAPALWIAFSIMLVIVDYWPAFEFRDPVAPAILAPYLALFYGSILAMGLVLFRPARRLWAITAVTSAAHLASMSWALAVGVG